MKNRRNIVFSTEKEWNAEESNDTPAAPKKQGTIYVLRDRKGRGGKTVTVIEGYAGDAKAMLKRLQKLCGSGGAVKNGNIEVQGDHRDTAAGFLRKEGFSVKLKGG